ncbi:GNAT family N-acetyltransferase [Massilia sp. RP-1-19]|uniref:GNAT family N-acetyltransferase n=1 Tax=Massilia polaris TaxID=2728846 RepID=A0A848HRQ7_9BURK|nr:GNAT family N-acetyltransferase [Massilia polaris]NML61288.1 GNAT family N-acetyltransferase [Massilia polaris]
MAKFTVRLAEERDLPELPALISASVGTLQKSFLTDAQIEASRAIMSLDTQLVRDGTYFVVECDGRIVGCGGWSKRATLYGGDNSVHARDPALLDPARDPARVRAMYTHPDFARQGVAKIILAMCETAAAAEGFARVGLMATMSGVPLYEANGYQAVAPNPVDVNGVEIPLIKMAKSLG